MSDLAYHSTQRCRVHYLYTSGHQRYVLSVASLVKRAPRWLDRHRRRCNLVNRRPVPWFPGKQTLELQRRVIGSEDPDTLSTEESLADIYRCEGRFQLSESMAMKALETERRALGPASPTVAMSLNMLSFDYAAQGRYSEAEDLLRQYSQGSSPNAAVDEAFALFLLVFADPPRRDPVQGLALARRALLSEPDNPDRLNMLGVAEVRNGLWDEAIGTLKKATTLHALALQTVGSLIRGVSDFSCR
jgi:tetratricopeptide (TPR) repeat protein